MPGGPSHFACSPGDLFPEKPKVTHPLADMQVGWGQTLIAKSVREREEGVSFWGGVVQVVEVGLADVFRG